MTRLEMLRSMTLFDGITDEQLSMFADSTQVCTAQPGDEILREGEHSGSMFILSKGSVEVSKRLGIVALGTEIERGPRKTIVRLNAPQFFGEMALLGDTERTATITAQTECELLEISKDAYDRLVERDITMGYSLLYNLAIVLCERLRRTDRDVLKLTAALSVALGNR